MKTMNQRMQLIISWTTLFNGSKILQQKIGSCGIVIEVMSRQLAKKPSIWVNQLKREEINSQRRFVHPLINDANIKLQIGTATDIIIISYDNWQKLGKPTLIHDQLQPINASGNPIHIFSHFKCTMKIGDHSGTGKCYVSSRLNLLRQDSALELPLDHNLQLSESVWTTRIHNTVLGSFP